MVDIAVGFGLVWVIVEDLRRFRIRNILVLFLVAAFFAASLEQDRLGLILSHLLFALLGLALLFGAFAARVIGGGDAKLLAAALLWIGPEGAFVFSVALLVFVLAYVVGARFGWLPARDRSGRTEIPYGPSIAAAWIAVLILSTYVRMQQG